MWLEKLEIRNYRCFEKVELTLPETGLVIITGRNNVGKTALLKAIDELVGSQPTGAVARDENKPMMVRGTFRLSGPERLEFLGAGKERGVDLDKPLRFQRIARGQHLQLAKQEWVVQLFFREKPDQLQTARLAKVPLPGENAEEIEARAHGIIQRFRERFFHFQPIRPGARGDNQNVQASATLRSDGSNLDEALLYLSSSKHPAEAQIQQLLNATVPDAGQLTTPVRERNLSIEFRDPHRAQQLPIKDLGTGVEQLVMAAYAGFRHDAGALLLLEEPEAHLHAGAQRVLADYLRQWSQHHQILVATHSPIFMDAGDATEVLLVERDKGVSTVRSANHDLPDVLSALGVRLSDVLSADRVLVVEGPSDKAILETWFRDLLRQHRVNIVVAGGGALSFRADKLVEWVESLETMDRPVLFIRDRDELCVADLERLTRKGVHVLDVREMENHLCQPAALRAALPGLADKSDAEIDLALRAHADRLRPMVHLKRVIQRLPRRRLVERAEISALLKDNAGRDGFLEHCKTRQEELTIPDETLTDLWAEVEGELDERWDAEWRAIAPGEEMLKALYAKHGGGKGFGKKSTGPRLAAQMDPPPALAEALRRWIDAPLPGG